MLTDLIFLSLMSFFIWHGATKGFIGSLVGPFSFVAATYAAFCYYNITKNIVISLGIGLLGPFILKRLLRFIFQLSGDGQKLSPLSRAAGVCVSVLWGMAIVLPIVFMLTFLPPVFSAWAPIKKDIKTSCTFILIKQMTKLCNLPTAEMELPSSGKSSSPPSSMKTLAQDQRMKNILSDPTIIKAIKDKNYAALFANPKILEAAQDPAFVQKLLSSYGQIQKNEQ